jgi:hypothetical protein
MSMGSSTPSLFPMLRLWAIILFCVLTYVHATATLGKEIARKSVRALSLIDTHGLLSLVPTPEGDLVSGPSFDHAALAKKCSAQVQAQQATA